MPTESESTAELTPEQQKMAEKLNAALPKQKYGVPEPAPDHRIKNAKFPDEDKQDW